MLQLHKESQSLDLFSNMRRFLGLFIGLQPKSRMILGSEGIWSMECSTGPRQIFCGEEAQKDYNQAGRMT